MGNTKVAKLTIIIVHEKGRKSYNSGNRSRQVFRYTKRGEGVRILIGNIRKIQSSIRQRLSSSSYLLFS